MSGLLRRLEDGPNQELALELLRFMAEKENIAEKVSTASGMPSSMKGPPATWALSTRATRNTRDSRVPLKFDWEYPPNGMWSTMKTVGSGVDRRGRMCGIKACQMMGEDWY